MGVKLDYIGPKASCKHIGALCYFCKSGQLVDFLTCTEQLQKLNQPRLKRVNIIPVTELSSHKEKLLKKEYSLILSYLTMILNQVQCV